MAKKETKRGKRYIRYSICFLKLSDRVWNYTDQFKTEIEMALDLGMRDGVSAVEMARNLKQYLEVLPRYR
ncbi:MAG: hypothetical protein LBD76_01135 [Prevotellaceae bacterium]|jgi:hypothetical protein|nr:hypothetical protein [Prevotellaceae bacterium]